jgi:hypothetical protein
MAEEHADPAEEEEEVEKGEQAAALNRLTGGGAEKELNTNRVQDAMLKLAKNTEEEVARQAERCARRHAPGGSGRCRAP